jgi:hypothetical protein
MTERGNCMAYPAPIDVTELIKVEGKKLTLILPTHRHNSENRGDKILAENYLREIKKYFKEESISDSDLLLKEMELLVGATNWNHVKDGIIYLVSESLSTSFDLDHRPEPRFDYGDHFALIELSRQIQSLPAINLLLLSELPTRFFSGKPMNLTEIDDEDFPDIHEGPGGLKGLPTGFGQMTSIVRDENHRKFFRRIESAVMKKLTSEPGPLFLLGVVKHLAFWREVAPQIEIAGEIRGNFDKHSVPQIQDLIQPLVNDYLIARGKKRGEEIEAALSQKKVAFESELKDLARDGKLSWLIVAQERDVISQELELTAWKTLAMGGSIDFVASEWLPDNSTALGLIRY